jgi:hypothetical protein
MTSDDQLDTVRRQLRLLAILRGAREAALVPVPAEQLHSIAFFADALAPVWGLRILDTQLLKRRSGPLSPALQQDLDRLVGQGLVVAGNVAHSRDEDGIWRLAADYDLNMSFAGEVLDRAEGFARFRSEFAFVREVVFAISRFDSGTITAATGSDASYGDALVDFGGLVDIETFRDRVNHSSRVAQRFGELMSSEAEVSLAPAELIHLYVRALQEQVEYAA